MTEKKSYCTFYPGKAPFDSCCHQHDRDYGYHGTKTRAKADSDLRQCVRDSGHPWQAAYIYLLIRAFGWLWWKKK